MECHFGYLKGKGKGRQVIACAKSADLILIILDASKYDDQKAKILHELDVVGIRLNKEKPNITIRHTAGGGVQLMSPYKLTKVTQDDVRIVCHEYRILNAQVTFKDDYDIDEIREAISAVGEIDCGFEFSYLPRIRKIRNNEYSFIIDIH